MRKLKTPYRKGIANNKIIAIAPTKNLKFRFVEIPKYIHRRELTEALENLAQSEIEGDLAMRAIANLQSLGGAE